MKSLPVVEDLDVFGDGEPCPAPGRERFLVVHFVLQSREPGFCGGVVPAHTGATHTGSDRVLPRKLGESC